MPNPRQESEGATRRPRSDPLPTQQRWTIVACVPGSLTMAYARHAVIEYPTATARPTAVVSPPIADHGPSS